MARDWIDQFNHERFTRTHLAILLVAGALLCVAGLALFAGPSTILHSSMNIAAPVPDTALPSPVQAAASPPEHAADDPAATGARHSASVSAVAPPDPVPHAPSSAPTVRAATAPATQPASQPAARVQWPNSDMWLLFSAGSTPLQLRYSSPRNDPILAPPIVWSIYSGKQEGGEKSADELDRFIRQRRPGARIGRYFSSCTARPTPLYAPAETLVTDTVREYLLPGSWPGEPTRRYIDIRRPEVRRLLARLFVAAARRSDFLSLDNFILNFGGNPEGTKREEWSEVNFALLHDIYAEARQAALPVVINAATRPEETWSRALQDCDGIVFEMPFHANVRKNPALLDRELAAYRAALNAGKFVGLVPLIDQKDKNEVRIEKTRLVAAGAMLIRDPGDALFVSQPTYQPIRDEWMEWPALFGRPQGACRHEGTTYTREFANGTLTVDFAAERITITPNRPTSRPSGRDPADR